MKTMMRKTTLREIKKSLGRYLAILAIVALGVGFFAGLRITKPSMIETAQAFFDAHHFYDYRLVSTLGFEEEDVERLSELDGVKIVEPAISKDFLTKNEKGVENALLALSITDSINTLELSEGRMPETADECVVDARYGGVQIGDVIPVLADNEEDTRDMFAFEEYKVVGKAKTPLYVNFERGSTDLLDGKLSGFIYLQKNGFECDYFTEIYLGYETGKKIYSTDYDDFAEAMEEEIKPVAEACLERRYDSIIEEAQEKIDDGQGELDDADNKLPDGQAKLDEANSQLADANEKLTDGKKKIDNGQKQIDSAKAELLQKEQEFEQIKGILPLEQAQMQAAQLEAAKQQLEAQQSALNKSKKDLSEKEEELADAQETYNRNLADFEEKKQEVADAKKKLADAESELTDAIDDMKDRKVYVLSRDTNIGYVTFQNDSSIVEGIANVFPIFFFLVAALVCMTTMNRMVEEQRTQIGVLKALGYSSITIMNKYLFYSMSAALVGGIVGFFGGCYLFPAVIWKAYGIMYDFASSINFLFDPVLAIAVLLVALLCCGGATLFSCYYELISQPSDLIRPKAPKSGKRIVLGKMPFLWKHFKFMQKVSIRNMFRYKKRFFMMILGISGCTALLVTGLGINDSITNIVDLQFDRVEKYNASINLDEVLSETSEDEFTREVSGDLSQFMLIHNGELDVSSGKVKKSVTMIVPKNPSQVSDFISIHDMDGNEIGFPENGEVVLTEKMAKKLSVSKGDTITLEDSDLNQLEVKVSGVCENFIYNYVYLNEETYTALTGEGPEYKSAYVIYAEGRSDEDALADLLQCKHVSSVAGNGTIQERFGNMIKSLDYVVALVIICAGALAFIVLYNLTNINITERIREIATIKVLGFFPAEVSAYVLRENLVLTVFGAAVGLLLGKALHAFVISQIDIDVVNFPILVKPGSYIISFILTFVFAILVNLFMGRKLEGIDMAESLKSIE